MLRVRRITGLERLIATVPKPKGAVPEFGLPGWKTMPLEQKIPMIPGPKDAYNFTRRKMGRKLWTTDGPRSGFDLSDPYCREVGFSYDPLHDEHLLQFFSRPVNLKCLLKADLITDDMDVKCSLRDYNEYRKYLRKVHVDRIKRELRRRHRLFVEGRALRFAEDQARQEAERLREREKLAGDRQRLVQQRQLQEEFRIQERKEKERKTARRRQLLRLIQQEERRLINIKYEERAEQIRQRCKFVTEIARRRTIDVSADWKRKDKARKKAKDKRQMDIEQQKQKILEERWIKKQHFHEKDIAKRETLLQRIDTRREKFIEEYNDKINKETARLRRLLDNVKLFTNCYVKRHLPDSRERVCCRKYFRSDTDRKDKAKNKSRDLVNVSTKPIKEKRTKMDKGRLRKYRRRS